MEFHLVPVGGTGSLPHICFKHSVQKLNLRKMFTAVVMWLRSAWALSSARVVPHMASWSVRAAHLIRWNCSCIGTASSSATLPASPTSPKASPSGLSASGAHCVRFSGKSSCMNLSHIGGIIAHHSGSLIGLDAPQGELFKKRLPCVVTCLVSLNMPQRQSMKAQLPVVHKLHSYAHHRLALAAGLQVLLLQQNRSSPELITTVCSAMFFERSCSCLQIVLGDGTFTSGFKILQGTWNYGPWSRWVESCPKPRFQPYSGWMPAVYYQLAVASAFFLLFFCTLLQTYPRSCGVWTECGQNCFCALTENELGKTFFYSYAYVMNIQILYKLILKRKRRDTLLWFLFWIHSAVFGHLLVVFGHTYQYLMHRVTQH